MRTIMVAVVLCLILALAALVPQARAQPLPSDQACREIVKTLDRVSTFRDRESANPTARRYFATARAG
jgi:hypothetical protein